MNLYCLINRVECLKCLHFLDMKWVIACDNSAEVYLEGRKLFEFILEIY